MKAEDLNIFEKMFLEVQDRPTDDLGYILSDCPKSVSGYLYVNAKNMVHVVMPTALNGRYGAGAGECGIRTSAFDTRWDACEFVKGLFCDFDKFIEFVEQGKRGTYLRPGEKPRKRRLTIEEKPADSNFAHIIKIIDINEAVKKFGKDHLIAARKTMTVGEFLEEFS